jgi:glycosyltransferase involved in cell wall biosynthesis
MDKGAIMTTRKKIGLLFNFDEGWTGGFYYLVNIINALKFLPDDEKPELIIFYKDEPLREKVQAIGYPFASYLPVQRKVSLITRVFSKAIRMLFDKRYYPQYPVDVADFIFPCTTPQHYHSASLRRIRKVFWIPDFQHKHLPQFFSSEELAQRDAVFEGISKLPVQLVLSSENALSDFNKFYPDSVAKPVVMRFATVLPDDYKKIPIEQLLSKYALSQSYFISPNQFWAHKNHIVILKAVVLMKRKGLDPLVVFTGKEQDYRNPDYFGSLKAFVEKNDIEKNIRFLGFIDRNDQLQLMKHSIAVIQPSLFEGWSTVVEDSKAMDQNIVLSDIEVHKEQCEDHATYFHPMNEAQLEKIMTFFMTKTPPPYSYHYQDKVVEYGKRLTSL